MLAKRLCTWGVFLLPLSVCLAQEEPASVTFRSQTQVVLLSFHVAHGKDYLTDLKPADFVLLEDGKPRDFTIFDSAATKGRMPLELVLLFDTNPRIHYFWDPAAVFRFIPEWTEAMSRAVLETKNADVRISVYRCSGQNLYRMSPGTKDAHQLFRTLHRLLRPGLPAAADTEIALALPARRKHVGDGVFTENFVSSPFVSVEGRGWPLEAAIGTLNDVAASPDKVARMLVMFSEGIGATTTVPEDVGNEALNLGIPIYPVSTNYENHIQPGYPRNYFRMQQFEALAKMTGGQKAEYPEIDAALLRKILESVRTHGLSQYVVGFVPPPSTGTPREHKLEIKLVSKSGRALEGGRRRATY